jgi:anti-repressor protein
MELIKVENKNGERMVSARELHQGLEVETRFNDWFSRMLKYGFEESTDYQAITQKKVTAQGNETTYTDYIIKLDMAKEISMIQRNAIGSKFRKYFIEVEKKYNKPKSALELAKEQVMILKELEAKQKELEYAIKTKAEIGSRREATAMVTAKIAIQDRKELSDEVDDLYGELGILENYHTVLRVQKQYKGKYSWKDLKRMSKKLGFEIKKVPCPRYGEVNAYHSEVWGVLYNLDL